MYAVLGAVAAINNFSDKKRLKEYGGYVMKYITFTVPSYNSQEYLERCIDSLLPGGNNVEIIIVNDGSSDNTAKIADGYALAYPNIVRVIHKENGGHGSGVNAGIKNAKGVYFKVVDSDDWLSKESYMTLLSNIKQTVDKGRQIDLFISNYVYNHLNEGLTNTIHYRNVFKANRESTWKDINHFNVSQYFMMHSLTFRTDIVRKSGVNLPEHTFYVDNIFAYQPLPFVKKLIYLDIDLYQYFIGREDQSVNEKSMVKHIDQHFRVTRAIMNCHNIDEIKKTSPKLAKYMVRKISILMAITSVVCSLENTKQAKIDRALLWKELKNKNKGLYNQVKFFSLNAFSVLPEPISDKVAISCYRFAMKKYLFS